MRLALEIIILITNLSYFVPWVFFKKLENNSKINTTILFLLFQSSIFGFLGIIWFLMSWSDIYLYQFASISRFLALVFILDNFIKHKYVTNIIALIATIIFTIECILIHGENQNNEVFTIFSNLILSGFTLSILFNKNQKSKIDLFSKNLSGVIFIVCASSLILGLYETELRSTKSIAAAFIIVYYNIVEIFQNLGITYSLWKLREA
jgi:hypothetical protein